MSATTYLSHGQPCWWCCYVVVSHRQEILLTSVRGAPKGVCHTHSAWVAADSESCATPRESLLLAWADAPLGIGWACLPIDELKRLGAKSLLVAVPLNWICGFLLAMPQLPCSRA